jgi:PAS domain S-box-containing protein
LSRASRAPPGEALEESAAELYEQAPCGYLSALPDGTIVRANQTFLAWTGYERSELLGERKFQDLLTVAGRIYCETHWAPLLRMQGFANEVAFDLLGKDGSPIPVLVNASQKRDERGEPLCNRITIFNATDRRTYERELLLQRRRAERADKEKADLLAMIGHDMRTPLNAIGVAVQLLERMSPTEQQSKYLRILRSSSAALLSLANQILDFSVIKAGQAVVSQDRFEIRVLINDVIDGLLSGAAEKRLEIRAEIDPAIPAAVWGDRAKIRQVLANLAGNAVKFTHAGSVMLSVRPLDSGSGSVVVEFAVTDTGIGIPGHRIDAIFEEFTQADPDIARKFGGTGLGLSISRKLAELLGGTLGVESEVGRGSTFRFRVRLGSGSRPE